MAGVDLDLRTLLQPLDEATFFKDHWEREPLLLARGDPGFYDGLFASADLDRVIAFTRPRFTDPSAFSKEPRRAQTVVQGWLAERPVQDSASFPGIADLRRVYAEGKTVVIMTMQQRWAPIAALCRRLEGVFHCPVHANMYLTPGGAQGFDAHFDTHEVFVLQLEGRKHWRLFDSARALPSVGERFDVPRDELGTPRDVQLEAGDLLYIPRGHVHEAFTSEHLSLHLTVGVNVYRWADLLHEALDEMTRRDSRFRGSLPPGVLGGNPLPSAVQDRARELLEVFARGALVENALGRLGDQFFAQLPVLPDGSFASGSGPGPGREGEGIGLETVLRRSPGAFFRVRLDGGWVVLESPGAQVGGPSRIAPALRFVARTERFPVRALPDELGDEGKLVLARRLLHERMLRVEGRSTEQVSPSGDAGK